jgi:hypothetical protein
MQAGPLPVLMTYRFGIEVGFGVSGQVFVSVSLEDYQADATSRAGVQYVNPNDTPCDPESDCYDYILNYELNGEGTDMEPLAEAEITVSFEAFVREEIGVTFYKTIGPEFWMKQFIGPQVTWPHEDCSITQAYVELIVGNDMGGRLNCGCMDRTFGTWEFWETEPITKTLWSDCLPEEP